MQSLIVHVVRRENRTTYDEIKPCLTYGAASDYLLRALHDYVEAWGSKPGDGFIMTWTDTDKPYEDSLSPEAVKLAVQDTSGNAKPTVLFSVRDRQTGAVQFELSVKEGIGR